MIQDICLGSVTIDCDDSQKLCDFYHGLLGWEKNEMFGFPTVQSENGMFFFIYRGRRLCSSCMAGRIR
jgi:hypothetical protein